MRNYTDAGRVISENELHRVDRKRIQEVGHLRRLNVQIKTEQ